ncbi:MAG: hypothetical protein ACI9A7_000877 [Cyclobacteriaceae bacterium]|jgi:hypothetical protein
MRFLKISFFVILTVILSSTANSQLKRKSSFFDKIYVGGGGGFGGGTDFLNISVSPLVGYKFTEQFSAGLITSYQYVKFGDATSSNYGGGPFTRYNVSEKFFAYAEYEYLNFAISPQGGVQERRSYTGLFTGIGYTEPIGDIMSINISALYNVLYGDGAGSPYNSPLLFRVGFVAGLF